MYTSFVIFAVIAASTFLLGFYRMLVNHWELEPILREAMRFYQIAAFFSLFGFLLLIIQLFVILLDRKKKGPPH
jgi:hypothetical protein